MTSFKTTQVADQCCLLFTDYTPCKHELLVTHVKEGVEITCKLCNLFTVYTSQDDVARVTNIFKRNKEKDN